MPENQTKAGKRVERINVNSEPHDKYRTNDPWTGEAISPGIPMLSSKRAGNVLDKKVTIRTIHCPKCDTEIHYDDDSEAVCASCGIICSAGENDRTEQMIIDAKAAGRVGGDGS